MKTKQIKVHRVCCNCAWYTMKDNLCHEHDREHSPDFVCDKHKPAPIGRQQEEDKMASQYTLAKGCNGCLQLGYDVLSDGSKVFSIWIYNHETPCLTEAHAYECYGKILQSLNHAETGKD